LRNILLVAGILTGQLWRAMLEERLLLHDPEYRAYGESVRHRFVPGLF
jgi:protein-S-isoprenylcysteine O-methyltransferase Ste14